MVSHPGRTRLADLMSAASELSSSRVLRVEHIHALQLPTGEVRLKGEYYGGSERGWIRENGRQLDEGAGRG